MLLKWAPFASFGRAGFGTSAGGGTNCQSSVTSPSTILPRWSSFTGTEQVFPCRFATPCETRAPKSAAPCGPWIRPSCPSSNCRA